MSIVSPLRLRQRVVLCLLIATLRLGFMCLARVLMPTSRSGVITPPEFLPTTFSFQFSIFNYTKTPAYKAGVFVIATVVLVIRDKTKRQPC